MDETLLTLSPALGCPPTPRRPRPPGSSAPTGTPQPSSGATAWRTAARWRGGAAPRGATAAPTTSSRWWRPSTARTGTARTWRWTSTGVGNQGGYGKLGGRVYFVLFFDVCLARGRRTPDFSTVRFTQPKIMCTYVRLSCIHSMSRAVRCLYFNSRGKIFVLSLTLLYSNSRKQFARYIFPLKYWKPLFTAAAAGNARTVRRWTWWGRRGRR